MPYYLKSPKGKFFYLCGKPFFNVGRKNCDILIENDASVSRNHAEIMLKGEGVFLRDCGSKYKTYINNEEVQANVETELTDGAKVKFGALESIFIFGNFNICTTSSCLNIDEKQSLLTNLKVLGVKHVPKLEIFCTHLTVKEIVLTTKVLCALTQNIAIVNLKFWEKYVERMKKHQEPPNAKEFKPEIRESLLNKDSKLEYDPIRKHLFRGKIFIYLSEKDRLQISDLITLCGGTSFSVEKSLIEVTELKKSYPEYILVQSTGCNSIKSPVKDNYENLVNIYSSLGKRTIPQHEIVLAVVECCCAKNCNPSFNRVEEFLRRDVPTLGLSQVLVANTEEASQNIRSSIVVPETVSTPTDSQSSLGEQLKDQHDDDLVNALNKIEFENVKECSLPKKQISVLSSKAEEPPTKKKKFVLKPTIADKDVDDDDDVQFMGVVPNTLPSDQSAKRRADASIESVNKKVCLETNKAVESAPVLETVQRQNKSVASYEMPIEKETIAEEYDDSSLVICVFKPLLVRAQSHDRLDHRNCSKFIKVQPSKSRRVIGVDEMDKVVVNSALLDE